MRSPYFLKLQRVMLEAGVFSPTLIIDRDRLDANIARLRADLAPGMAYRIVAKSLPIPQMIARIRAMTGTDRLMAFNLPMLRDLSHHMPDADQMLGKPLPVQACAAFLADHRADHVQWLIDTPARMRDYADLAQSRGVTLRVAIELDVGLHRGGVAAGPELGAILAQIEASDHLRLSGVMGYEPHLASVPPVPGWAGLARRRSAAAYRAALAQISAQFGAEACATLTRNVAGSPTFRLYRDTALANEVAVGSALVKPCDFDTALLRSYEPAAFIATPVLKVAARGQMPVLDILPRLSRRGHLFIHGGKWMANPVDPTGMRPSGIFGRSSNQEMLSTPAGTQIAPGDLAFLRPTQSEAVLMQFGTALIYSQGRIVDRWDPLDWSV